MVGKGGEALDCKQTERGIYDFSCANQVNDCPARQTEHQSGQLKGGKALVQDCRP